MLMQIAPYVVAAALFVTLFWDDLKAVWWQL